MNFRILTASTPKGPAFFTFESAYCPPALRSASVVVVLPDLLYATYFARRLASLLTILMIGRAVVSSACVEVRDDLLSREFGCPFHRTLDDSLPPPFQRLDHRRTDDSGLE